MRDSLIGRTIEFFDEKDEPQLYADIGGELTEIDSSMTWKVPLLTLLVEIVLILVFLIIVRRFI